MRPLNGVMDYLRHVAIPRDGGEATDGQLLTLFIGHGDQSAFQTLVSRHGPMVLGVCQRVLHHMHDAEDAFQATFLVLVRRADSVMPREMVGNWLYGVAYRTALEAKGAAAKRRAKERVMPRREAIDNNPWSELQPLLDQELSRLPDKYRVPIVLCDLEGKTRKEAARRLGWPEGTLSGRLSRARVLLAKRLARHGLTLSGGAVAVVLSQNAASAQVPVALMLATFKAATSVAAGSAAGAISAPVAALTEGVLRAMLVAKLKYVTAAFLTLALLGVCLGAAVYQTPVAEPAQAMKIATDKLPAVIDPHLPATEPAAPPEEVPDRSAPADTTRLPKEVDKDPAPKSTTDDAKVPVKLDLPYGRAPVPALVCMGKEGRIAITRIVMAPKKPPITRDFPAGNYMFSTKITKEFKPEEIEVYDATGKKIDAKDLPKRLEREVLVLSSADGNKVDPGYLSLMKEGTLIFVFPPFQWEDPLPKPLKENRLDPERLKRPADGNPGNTLPVIPSPEGTRTVPKDP
jgi:RNA polymerase sigma factor (sigma-70 family)